MDSSTTISSVVGSIEGEGGFHFLQGGDRLLVYLAPVKTNVWSDNIIIWMSVAYNISSQMLKKETRKGRITLAFFD